MEKRVQDYTQEILDTIRSNSSPAVMGSRLEDYHENDLADVLPLLTVPERCKLYRILDTDMLSDIFEYAESDNVAEPKKPISAIAGTPLQNKNIQIMTTAAILVTAVRTGCRFRLAERNAESDL